MSASGERGFALLALLLLVGVGGLVAIAAVEQVVAPDADQAVASAERLAETAGAARRAFRAAGAFPSRLDTLAAAAGMATDGPWRSDPFRPGRDLDYRVRSRDVTVRSAGPDRRLNTADDVAFAVDDEPLVRLRQRARLRVLRAVFAASAYRTTWMMSSAENAAMRAAMRDYAAAKRAWLTTDAAGRVLLQQRLDDAEAAVDALVIAHGLRSLPARLTGGSGLLSVLGLSTARAVDGTGAALLLDPVVGFVARGSDRTRNTDDDM